MKTFYISTPITGDAKKNIETAKRASNWFRLSAISLSPVLAFDYLDQGDWLFQSNAMDLMTLCDEVYVFTDEVTEFMIAEIKKAQKLGKPVHFYDSDRKEINYDALIINKRIGPGYRKMIVEAHGDSCCPCCGELREAKAPEDKPAAKTETVAVTPPVKETAPELPTADKPSIFARLFGKAR